jgi:hypothetical protein
MICPTAAIAFSSGVSSAAEDDGFGVAVALEAARSIASRQGRRWTLFVLLTDGEELGLMGAAGLAADREIADRLKAHPSRRSGPASRSRSSRPAQQRVARGAVSCHARTPGVLDSGHRRLPNDTDFSILQTRIETPRERGGSHAPHGFDRPRLLQRAGG